VHMREIVDLPYLDSELVERFDTDHDYVTVALDGMRQRVPRLTDPELDVVKGLFEEPQAAGVSE